MTQKIDLGDVNSVAVKSDPQDGEVFILVLSDEAATKATIRASREALRSLWSHLTSVLYPRAADQLTKRIETVKREKENAPNDVAYTAVAYTVANDKQHVVIGGTSHDLFWTARLTHERADDLWSTLEDKLDQV